MSKHLFVSKEAEPDHRARRVSSACAAPAAVVERERAVIVSPAGREALQGFVRLLARQAAREDRSSQGEGG